MHEILKEAMAILWEKASKYKPIQEAVLIVECDKNGTRWVETDYWDREDTCIDCAYEAVELASMHYEGKLYAGGGHGNLEFDFKTYDPVFGDNLTSVFVCQSCGEYGEFSVSPDDQEMKHWEKDVQDSDLLIAGMHGCTAWELWYIFDCWDERDREAARVVSLAKRIIDVNRSNP